MCWTGGHRAVRDLGVSGPLGGRARRMARRGRGGLGKRLPALPEHADESLRPGRGAVVAHLSRKEMSPLRKDTAKRIGEMTGRRDGNLGGAGLPEVGPWSHLIRTDQSRAHVLVMKRSILAAIILILSVGGCSDLSSPMSTDGPAPEPETYPWIVTNPEAHGLSTAALQAALSYAFQPGNQTGAVLVIRNGQTIAESYAQNRQSTDLVTSWSVAKSFTSALVGAALEDSILESLEQRASYFLTYWLDDPIKSQITMDHLMTLRSGLIRLEGSDLYNAEDQLQVSLDRQVLGDPGEQLYTYSNADVMLISGVIETATGRSAQSYLDEQISGPIGFQGEWWTDGVGSTLGYCCLDATPRDFARFGILYAQDGVWEGEQVIPRDWVLASTAPARSGTYAYYWWPMQQGGFAAIGIHGQLIAIFPALDLVLLRFSEYTRWGDGSTVRVGGNYHGTQEPENFDIGTFVSLALGAVRN